MCAAVLIVPQPETHSELLYPDIHDTYDTLVEIAWIVYLTTIAEYLTTVEILLAYVPPFVTDPSLGAGYDSLGHGSIQSP